MSDALDALLSTPLEEPADNGFSLRVITAIADVRLRQARREAVLSCLVVALLFAIAALTPAGAAVAHTVQLLLATPAVLFGCLMLALSGVVYSQVRA